MKTKNLAVRLLALICSGLLCSACAGGNQEAEMQNGKDTGAVQTEEKNAQLQEKSGLENESAKDGHIDFRILQQQNPEVFAWLYIPGTNIDFPILQSSQSDDYYKSHGADGGEDEKGALYTEMANLMNLCDFNTIIHGKDAAEGDLFYELHLFEKPDFFAEHKNFYIYLPDNVLTYEIFTAYYDEAQDLLRRHDYTTYQGCQNYLDEMYKARDMGRNFREGWEELTPYHFLVTLDGVVGEDSQYVVIGVLTGDAAGTIDRVIYD